MGVDLGDLIEARKIGFRELSGKKIAIDAYNALYQFLAIIRQPTGEPLMDSKGNITSHLSGLLYRTTNLLEFGILPVYVFDGIPPKLKIKTLEERVEIREEAEEKWKEALEKGDLEEARVHAQASAKLSKSMVEDAKELLSYLGIPLVQAPEEGEAQAAYMNIKGDVYASASQDYDSLLFGARRLVRNLTITGKRKLPRKNIYVEIVPELIESGKTLEDLGITIEQLIEIGILIGTDYNPKGMQNIGPKKAYKIISEHGSIENAIERKAIPEPEFNYKGIKKLFLDYKKTDDYELKWNKPNEEKVIDFLCRERDFSVDRVKNAISRMKVAIDEYVSQIKLDSWFK